MHLSNITCFIMITVQQFASIFYVFFVLLAFLFTVLAVISIYKKRVAANKQQWNEIIAVIISEAIFKEDENAPLKLNNNTTLLLQNPAFRQQVINELILAKKNLSGTFSLSLDKLYADLELDKDSYEKLNNQFFHLKAKGIQELAVMSQVKYEKEIFWLTNHKDELVRNEAQCAVVSFSGYSGLRFLDVTPYPVSQWQQIQLLNKLNGIKPDYFDFLKKWLQSSNDSVVVFALKLSTFCNCFDVYDNIILCLQHPNMQVKLNALAYLKIMPREETPGKILECYSINDKAYKLAILDTLQYIGTEHQIPFLLKQLYDTDNDIIATAAKTLSHVHPSGAAFLQQHSFADVNPWKAIFLHIDNKHAA